MSATRMVEGDLATQRYSRLDRYFRDPGAAGASSSDPRAALDDNGTGMRLFFRLYRPADPMPAGLEPGIAYKDVIPVRYFDYLGNPGTLGTLEQQVELEGVEDIVCPAGTFANCVRLRVTLKIHFPWTSLTDLTSYIWLSPEVGEVRRVQQFSGWFLLFWFGSADEYRLVSYEPPARRPPADRLPDPKWADGLVLVQGRFPRLRLGGMVIDMRSVQPITQPAPPERPASE